MVGNIKETKEILEKYQKRAKKSFGQNFLVDENILHKIINHAELDKTIGIIEIGPGLGALTQHLANHAKKVLAYEIDEFMLEVLKETLGAYDNVKIINQDILKANIISDINKYLNDCEKIVVIANLPYYITTPIIFKFLELDFSFGYYIFMVQKEMAERLTSKPQTKDYNALSVMMNYKTNSRMLFNVSRNCFYPAPKVESAVIKIEEIDKGYNVDNEELFFKFVRGIFVNRRKTLINNINSTFKIEKDIIKNVLKAQDFKENVRPEELSTGNIVTLYNLLKDFLNY